MYLHLSIKYLSKRLSRAASRLRSAVTDKTIRQNGTNHPGGGGVSSSCLVLFLRPTRRFFCSKLHKPSRRQVTVIVFVGRNSTRSMHCTPFMPRCISKLCSSNSANLNRSRRCSAVSAFKEECHSSMTPWTGPGGFIFLELFFVHCLCPAVPCPENGLSTSSQKFVLAS